MEAKINKIQTIVLCVFVLLIFSNVALAKNDIEFNIFEGYNNSINTENSNKNINKKSFDHKRIILESISENDIDEIIEKGCSVKHKLQKATSFKCPKDINLQNLNAREARIFHIVGLSSAQQINATDVWAEGINGSGVKVVILDTGVDNSHPELSDSYLGGYDFINDDNNPEDDHGHGTHVAGIITANGAYANATGVAPNASFYMLKVCDSNGDCPEDDIMAAMEYAIGLDAKVMSISIGGGNNASPNCDSDPIAAKVNDVVDNGISVVISSGNDGNYVSYPACASKAIAVGAVDDNGYVTWWSNFGPSLDIVAPGVSILSAYSCLAAGDCGSIWYAYMSGTSMSAPHVSGVIALLLDANHSLNDTEIKNALYSTATPATGCYRCSFITKDECHGLGEVTCTSNDTGAGIVNAYDAYLSVMPTTTTTSTTTTTTTIPCIDITEINLLDGNMNPVSELTHRQMYNIQVKNYNQCDDPIVPMQIVQISKDLTPVNIGTVKATVRNKTQSVITVGFHTMGSGTYTADVFNWNHWSSQPDWEAYSTPGSIQFEVN